MKKIKILTAALLSLCLAFAVTGCSGDNLKDSVINGFNDMLQHFSKYALTDEKDLQGDKTGRTKYPWVRVDAPSEEYCATLPSELELPF